MTSNSNSLLVLHTYLYKYIDTYALIMLFRCTLAKRNETPLPSAEFTMSLKQIV